jgi:hypothetical protein
MDLKRRICDDWEFQQSFTPGDISIVAFACQLIKEDSGIEDDDGFVSSKHMEQIEKMFPTITGRRTTKVYELADSIVKQFQEEF